MAEQGSTATAVAYVLKYRVPLARQRQFFARIKELSGQLTSTSGRAELPVEEVRLLQPMFGDDETVWELQIRFASAQALGHWMDAASNELSSDGDEVPSPRTFANVVNGVELMVAATSPLYRLYSFQTARSTATPAAGPQAES